MPVPLYIPVRVYIRAVFRVSGRHHAGRTGCRCDARLKAVNPLVGVKVAIERPLAHTERNQVRAAYNRPTCLLD